MALDQGRNFPGAVVNDIMVATFDNA